MYLGAISEKEKHKVQHEIHKHGINQRHHNVSVNTVLGRPTVARAADKITNQVTSMMSLKLVMLHLP